MWRRGKSLVLHTGREDPDPLDGSGGHRVQEVHVGQRRVELRDRHVGGDVVRREALLGDVQSGCKFHVAFTGSSAVESFIFRM